MTGAAVEAVVVTGTLLVALDVVVVVAVVVFVVVVVVDEEETDPAKFEPSVDADNVAEVVGCCWLVVIDVAALLVVEVVVVLDELVAVAALDECPLMQSVMSTDSASPYLHLSNFNEKSQ